MCAGNCKGCKSCKGCKRDEMTLVERTLDRINEYLDDKLCGENCPLYDYYKSMEDYSEVCLASKAGVTTGHYSLLCYMPYFVKWLYLQIIVFKIFD